MISCYVKTLSSCPSRCLVPRLSSVPLLRNCSHRANVPTYTPLLDIIKSRQAEARRSVLVQVAGPNSALDLASYCHENFGKVDSLHYFHNQTSKNFSHFFIVNFHKSESVNNVFNSGHHSNSEDKATPPVPVYSPFLWFQGGRTSKNINSFKSIPVDYGLQDTSESTLRNMTDVSEQMYQLWRRTNMTDTSLRLRFLVCRQLELAISGMFPHCQVLPFGSAINGFGTCASDQDMLLELDTVRLDTRQQTGCDRLVFQAKGQVFGGDRAQVQRYCEELASIIQAFLPGCQDVQKILNARVPLIKYTHELTGLECDLSMSSESGLHMSCLLHVWGDMDWRVRPLVASVRRWARAVGLVKDMRPTNFFTNFTLTMLVVCYLQSLGMLPAFSVLAEKATKDDQFQCRDGVKATFLHNINNRKEELNKCYHDNTPLTELLLGFFVYYAQFDFSKDLLCPITGSSRLKSHKWIHSSCLDLINPLEPSLNVSYNIKTRPLELFQENCRKAIKKLKVINSSVGKEENVKDGLFWVFESDGDYQPRKRVSLNIPSLLEIGLGGDPDKKTTHKNEPSKVKRLSNKDLKGASIQSTVSTLFSESSEDKQPRTSIKDEDEIRRLEKLKVKYLRGSTHSKFNYKM